MLLAAALRARGRGQGTPGQLLLTAYERARQNGMDVGSLFLDFSHTKPVTYRPVATMASFQSLR